MSQAPAPQQDAETRTASDPGLVPAKKPRKQRVTADGSKKPEAKKRQIAVLSGAGIEMVPIAVLQANPRNARKHTESQVADIATSIKRFGFRNPVFIDAGNTIWAGHGRVMAAKKCGLTEVPCIRANDLSEAKLRAYALADNRIALNAFWDNDLLAEEMKALDRSEESLTGLGFDEAEVKELLAVTLEVPEIGDLEGVVVTSDTAFENDDEAASAEYDDPLAPVADPEKDRYHQLPPDDASRAIRASEERIPLAILLNRDEHEKFVDYRKTIGAKSDKEAFCVLMGWKDHNAMSPQTAEKIAKKRARDSGDQNATAEQAAAPGGEA